MPKILIIIGSTREGRISQGVGRWVAKQAAERTDFTSELADLRDWPLPFFASNISPGSPEYKPEGIVQQWAEKIASADGFVVVTPEYNHGYPAVLKNALDHLYREWNQKPIAFVSYGSVGGARAVEQLRQVAVELQMAPIREAVSIMSFWKELDENGAPKDPAYGKRLTTLFDQLLWWTNALKTARSG